MPNGDDENFGEEEDYQERLETPEQEYLELYDRIDAGIPEDYTAGIILPEGEDYFIVSIEGETFVFDLDDYDDVTEYLDGQDIEYAVYEG